VLEDIHEWNFVGKGVSRAEGRDSITRKLCLYLLNPAGNLREDCVGVGANHPHHADDDDQNHGEHNRVLSYVLSLYFAPNALKKQTNSGAHRVT
jgi:hypothetical protein